MKMSFLWMLCLACFFASSTSFPTNNSSFVVTTSVTEISATKEFTTEPPPAPNIYEMNIIANISNRFANTVIISKVENEADFHQETTFRVILPETAYITRFLMEVDGKNYTASVKRKMDAQNIYTEAAYVGKAAAHVEAKARDSNRFTVKVNIPASSRATFYLTYEELLKRKENYEVVINIHPNQLVESLNVKVYIAESKAVKFVRILPIRSGNEEKLLENNHSLESNATVTFLDSKRCLVEFKPSVGRQKQLAKALKAIEESNLRENNLSAGDGNLKIRDANINIGVNNLNMRDNNLNISDNNISNNNNIRDNNNTSDNNNIGDNDLITRDNTLNVIDNKVKIEDNKQSIRENLSGSMEKDSFEEDGQKLVQKKTLETSSEENVSKSNEEDTTKPLEENSLKSLEGSILKSLEQKGHVEENLLLGSINEDVSIEENVLSNGNILAQKNISVLVNLPIENVRQENILETNMQQDTLANKLEQINPEKNKPAKVIPAKVIPGKNTPEKNTPEKNTPENNTPEKNIPETNTPEKNTLEKNTPEKNNPEKNKPENIKPENTKSENAMPESDSFASGLSGQFIVQYDVEREHSGGEVLLKDGYFVHFFAPTDLDPLPIHVVFVLDTSGSMMFQKIEQLRSAMKNILKEMKDSDVFHLVEFSNYVSVWDLIRPSESVKFPREKGDAFWFAEDHYFPIENMTFPSASTPNEDMILKASQILDVLEANGGTNIYEALRVGLQLIYIERKKDSQYSPQPMLVFLTDGEPTVGITELEKIIEKITELNVMRIPVFSLSFGDGADKDFLQTLSLKNYGFSRHIYEAADASLQLQNFYREISSPMLTNVKFKYTQDAQKLTKTVLPIYFGGGEFVVTGYIDDVDEFGKGSKVSGWGVQGPVDLRPYFYEAAGELERLWAYLTVQQLLESKIAEDSSGAEEKAVELALKYSFVTPFTSLVVVRPTEGELILSTESASPRFEENDGLSRSAMPVQLSSMDVVIMDFEESSEREEKVPSLDFFEKLSVSFPWLPFVLDRENATIKIPQGVFLVTEELENGSVRTQCFNYPPAFGNGTAYCALLGTCENVQSILTSLEVYSLYFCSLHDTYAGVCCPDL